MKKKRILNNIMDYMKLVLIILFIVLLLTACERNVKDKHITFQSTVGEISGEYTGTLIDGEPSESGTLCVYHKNGNLYRKYHLNGKRVVSCEFYRQNLKCKQFFYEDGKPKRGKWFDQMGNAIWESGITESGDPELIVKEGCNYDFCNVIDTTHFTKSNIWKFYAGYCEIANNITQYAGPNSYVVEAYITDLSGNRDKNLVSFTVYSDDYISYEENDIFFWQGQLVSVGAIDTYKFDLIRKSR